jgi:hypothetical protein
MIVPRTGSLNTALPRLYCQHTKSAYAMRKEHRGSHLLHKRLHVRKGLAKVNTVCKDGRFPDR